MVLFFISNGEQFQNFHEFLVLEHVWGWCFSYVNELLAVSFEEPDTFTDSKELDLFLR